MSNRIIKATRLRIFFFRTFHSNSRALSPIFATLIILGVVTVLFIPVFIWTAGITSQTQDSWSKSGQTATELIVIEEVSLKSGQQCNIYVRNIGKTSVSIDNIFISRADGSGTIYPYSNPTLIPAYPVVQGELVTITITELSPFLPQAEIAYLVQVYTQRGVGASYQVVAS